jgi:flagellar secretion chaperone FliS
MFGQTALATNAYRRLAVESAALGADRHQLIAMLFEGAQTAISQARAALARGDIAAKAVASSRAIRLVDEGLKVAVDRSVGEMGESLFQLWSYCARRLLHAHLKHDDGAYAEVAALIGQIESAWAGIGPNGAPTTLRRAA